MKQTIFYSLLFSILALASCRKEDNPKLPDLYRVTTPLIKKVTEADQVISVQDPTAFKGKFTVEMYNKNDVPPQKFDVVVIKNGNKASVKTIKDNITTFPATVEITGQQLATLFGEVPELGDKYDIGVDVTIQSGQKFEAFPQGGTGIYAGVNSQAGASTSIRYEAVCKYDPSIYEGTFVVEEDEWEDYHAGDLVTITKVDDKTFSFKHVAAVNAEPIIIKVNTVDNSVQVAKQSVGTRWAYGATYTAPFVATTGSASSSFVSPCEQSVTLNLQYGYSAGTFGGTYVLTLKKQ